MPYFYIFLCQGVSYMKKVLSISVLIVMLLSLSSCTRRKQKTTDEAEYENYLSKVEYSEDYMPSMAWCGNYSSATATYKHEYLIFFDVYTVGLFLSYNEYEYNSQKNAILSDYKFFSVGDESLDSDCDATIEDYNIQLVKDEYEYSTMKMGLLIGLDDTNYKICYLFYYDFDLDSLDDLDSYIEDFFYFP